MKLNEYIKEWISIGPKFHLSKMVIIGPYPTKDFFEELLCHSPAKLYLLVDDGWPEDRLDQIRDVCKENKRKVTIRRVAPYNNNGLVHAKLYYFEWKNSQENYTRRILLAGSANASKQGFGMHAESFVSIDFADMSKDHRNDALSYIEALEQGKDVEPILLTIGHNKSWLTLPALRVVDTGLINGFDAWLRRGKLSHKYQPDPAFGRLLLRLKKPMPKTAFEENLGESGFIISGDSQSFSQQYVTFEIESEDTEKQTWRQQFFIETDYGFWTSGECFAQCNEKFVASQDEGRRQAIKKIIEADDQKKWIDSFVKSIEGSARRLNDPVQIAEYFDVKMDGKLDIDKYKKKASKKLSVDRQKAKDDYFYKRFISGFAFPPVPQFGDEFQEFAISFCCNLLAKIHGKRVQNKLAQLLRTELMQPRESCGFPESGEALYSYLNKYWEVLRQNIVLFHEN